MWLTWYKQSDYRENLRCHASDWLTEKHGKVEQYSVWAVSNTEDLNFSHFIVNKNLKSQELNFFTQLGFENKRIYFMSYLAKESGCFSLCYSFSRIVPVLRSITCLSWVFVWPSLFSTKRRPNQFQAPQMCFFSIRLFFNNINTKITLTPIGKMFHCSSSPHPASLVHWFWARKRCRKLLKDLKFQYAFTKLLYYIIQALNKQKNNKINDIKTKVTSEFATTAFTLSSLEDLCFFLIWNYLCFVKTNLGGWALEAILASS